MSSASASAIATDSPGRHRASAAAAAGVRARGAVPADQPPAYYRPDRIRARQGLLPMLWRARQALGQLVNEAIDLEGSSVPQWVLLHQVHQGHANTVVGLARACMCDAGAMTRMIDRIEKKSLCRRAPCPEDRRVVRIELTPEGQAVAERVPQVLSQVYNRALTHFSREEWRQLENLLMRLADDAERLSLKNGNCSS